MTCAGLAAVVLTSGIVASVAADGGLTAVVGASGNVGKLVALRLADNRPVRAIVRDKSSVAEFLNKPNIELVEADVRTDAEPGGALESALRGARTVVACTGTTAFPTKAWSKSGDSDVTGAVVSALVDSGFSITNALTLLDGQGLNTPSNVDDKGVRAILRAWEAGAGASREHFVLMSSVGVTRRDGFPFKILNACGVLDAKASGEAAVKEGAAKGAYDYTIVRPGQLFGGPYTNNYYLGTLFQLDKDADTQDVRVARGDTLLGDTLRSTLAEVIATIVESKVARGTDVSVINEPGTPPSSEQLKERLMAL